MRIHKKARIYNLIIMSLIILSFVSCDRPECTNKNPIFENHQPSSKEYKDELVKQLDIVDKTKLTYWLQKYSEAAGEEYLYFYIQGDGLCAKLVLTMSQWDKLENVRETKGVSYRGAEFTNLEFEIQSDSESTEFIYKSFDNILD